MPARICPDCGRHHNHTAYRCTTCYLHGGSRRRRRYYAPPSCGDGICGKPATEVRLIIVGLPDHGITQDDGWLFLCPDCAALFDAEEGRTISPVIIPSRAAARGHVCC